MARSVWPLLALLFLASPSPAGADDIADLWQGTHWGEASDALAAQFGRRATVLPRAIDFGDSYANVVLRDVTVGGVRLIAFFQMDKAAGGLKRIQLERPRHGVTPTAFQAVLGALEAGFGAPNALCRVRPGPASGYQAAAERIWRRDGVVIRAIFRDTTIEAFEGCLDTDGGVSPCGLTGQLLVRISPPDGDDANCRPSAGLPARGRRSD